MCFIHTDVTVNYDVLYSEVALDFLTILQNDGTRSNIMKVIIRIMWRARMNVTRSTHTTSVIDRSIVIVVLGTPGLELVSCVECSLALYYEAGLGG